jgi:hypothetical protein
LKNVAKNSQPLANNVFSDPPNSTSELRLNSYKRAAVIQNMCLSGNQKAELVILITSIQTLASFTHLVAQKPD